MSHQFSVTITLSISHWTRHQDTMKLLSLLTVVIVLIGLTTQAFACYYERMSRSPNYAMITTPKKTLNIPHPYGICVAPNGDFAVVSRNNAKKFRIYYSCGKLMKEVDLSKQGFKVGCDCAFTDSRLYVTDCDGKKIYELSTLGEFVRIFATGPHCPHMAACKDRLYFTTGQNVFVYDTNGRLIRRISVPGNVARGVIVGIDGNLHVSNWHRKQVYVYTPEGRQVGVTTYNEIHIADGLAMDTAGNLLIADHGRGKVGVYSPCGALIKTIRTGTRNAVDVEIGNDGTVLVADHGSSKVYMF